MKWRSLTTVWTAKPGFPSSCAAQAIRVRSITRLRFGAPPAPNWRDRCSRLMRSRLRQGRGSHRPLDLTNQHIPGCLLQRLGEPKHARSIDQGAPPLGSDGRSKHEIADHRIVYPFHQHGRDGVHSARQEQIAIVRAEGCVGYDRNRRAGGIGGRTRPTADADAARARLRPRDGSEAAGARLRGSGRTRRWDHPWVWCAVVPEVRCDLPTGQRLRACSSGGTDGTAVPVVAPRCLPRLSAGSALSRPADRVTAVPPPSVCPPPPVRLRPPPAFEPSPLRA